MSNVDLTKLSYAELIDLNDAVVKRIRVLNGRRQEDAASQFKVGQRVEFDAKRGGTISGTIVKINRKTVKVDCGGHLVYRVSPSLLRAA